MQGHVVGHAQTAAMMYPQPPPPPQQHPQSVVGASAVQQQQQQNYGGFAPVRRQMDYFEDPSIMNPYGEPENDENGSLNDDGTYANEEDYSLPQPQLYDDYQFAVPPTRPSPPGSPPLSPNRGYPYTPYRAHQNGNITSNQPLSPQRITSPPTSPTRVGSPNPTTVTRGAYQSPQRLDSPKSPSANSKTASPLSASMKSKYPNCKFDQNLTESDTWTGIDLSSCGLYSLSKSIANYVHLTALFLQKNNFSSLPEWVTMLTNLTHLDVSHNQLQVVTPLIDRLQHLTHLDLSHNKLNALPPEVGHLFRLKKFDVSDNPMNIVLRDTSLFVHFRDRLPAPPPPPTREWLVSDNIIREPNKELESFTVMSYNILADMYASPETYRYCPPWALDWNNRKKLVLEQIKALSPAVICLQEVETKQFVDFFLPSLTAIGYTGVFKPKSRARHVIENSKVDGCCIFFQTTKFSLVDTILIEFQSLSMTHFGSCSPTTVPLTPDVFERILSRDNIALLTVLKSNKTGRLIIVSTTHIHWDPSSSDVKLIQSQFLVEEIASVKANIEKSGNMDVPVIVAGDFNSTPVSGVYSFLRDGHLAPNHPDFNGFKYGDYSIKGLTHNLQFASAYSNFGEPPYTNFSSEFSGCIDYIWHTTPNTAVTSVLPVLSKEVVSQQKIPFPNAVTPSDHVFIAANFSWLSSSPGTTAPNSTAPPKPVTSTSASTSTSNSNSSSNSGGTAAAPTTTATATNSDSTSEKSSGTAPAPAPTPSSSE
ncbi:glucose-repressible alcohol dehydrogenase transcriptional effector [Pelomyxa schiedti]|nr:glucose-repressible alcohol dehydrogenase transcriptional effector [Pelomyxa schiedti]